MEVNPVLPDGPDEKGILPPTPIPKTCPECGERHQRFRIKTVRQRKAVIGLYLGWLLLLLGLGTAFALSSVWLQEEGMINGLLPGRVKWLLGLPGISLVVWAFAVPKVRISECQCVWRMKCYLRNY